MTKALFQMSFEELVEHLNRLLNETWPNTNFPRISWDLVHAAELALADRMAQPRMARKGEVK